MSEIDKCDYTFILLLYYWMLLLYLCEYTTNALYFILQFNNDQHNKWNNIVIFTKEYDNVVKLTFTYFYFGVAFVAYWVGFCRGCFCLGGLCLSVQ